MLRQERGFVCSLEIQLAVAGVNFVEESKIVGNRVREFAIGGRYERDVAAPAFSLLQKIEHLLTVGKSSGIELNPGSELAFQEGASRKQPEGQEAASVRGRVLSRTRTHSQRRLPRIKVPSRSTHKTGDSSLAGLVPVTDPIKMIVANEESEMPE